MNLAVQVSAEPRQIGVSILKSAFTHELVDGSRAFVLNILKREDKAAVRKFVKPVELVDATMNGFAFRNGITGAPILEMAASYIECEVRQAVDVGDHTFFIGEVVDANFQAPEDTEVLRMEDTRMHYGG